MKTACLLLTTSLCLCGFQAPGGSSDVEIREVRSLTGGYYRVGAWHPMEVVVRSEKGFAGALIVEGSGVQVSLDVTIPAGREAAVATVGLAGAVVHEIKIRLVSGGATVAERPYQGRLEAVGGSDRLVGVAEEVWDKRDDPAWFRGEGAGRRRHFPLPDRLLAGRADLFLDAVDAIVVGDKGEPARAPAEWRLRGGIVVPISEVVRHPIPERLLTIGKPWPSLGRLTGDKKWYPPKSEKALVAILLYFFVAFLLMVYLTVRRVRWRVFTVVSLLLGVLFSLGVAFVGGSRDLAVEVSDLVLCDGKEAVDLRLYAVRCDRTGAYDLTFDSPARPLARPLLAGAASGAPMKIDLKEDGRCVLSSHALARGATSWFVSARLVAMPEIEIRGVDDGGVANTGRHPVSEAFYLDGSRALRLGDLTPGGRVEVPNTDESEPRQPSHVRLVTSAGWFPAGAVVGLIEPDRFFGSGVESPDLDGAFRGRTIVLVRPLDHFAGK